MIRRATGEDAGALAALQRSMDLFEIVRHETPVATEERVARQLGRCLRDDSHAVFVAVGEPDGVVGYAAVHWLPYLIHAEPEGYLSELFVDQRARGRGVGTRLLEAVEAEARARGCARLQLVNLRDRESYRRGFYAKHGWDEGPERASFVKRLHG